MLRPGALDIGPLYQAFSTLAMEGGRADLDRIADDRVSILAKRFRSTAEMYQRPEDRGHAENASFQYPIFLSAGRESPPPHALVVLHGLNEAYFQKLFPWAYAYTVETGAPSLIFPMAFYLNRRPLSLFVANRVFLRLYRTRQALAGNRWASPFNAPRSEWLTEHPERLAGEMLQSYHDLRQLAAAARDGRLPPLPPGTVLHFLGYSLGGYLTLMLLAADPDQLFADSRAVLFASGGPVLLDDVQGRINPRSLLIMDEIASHRILGFTEALVGRLSGRAAGPATPPTIADAVEHVVQAMRTDTDRLALKTAGEIFDATAPPPAALARIAERVISVAGDRDTVIPAAGIRASLGRVLSSMTAIRSGNHEYPFNLDENLPDDYHRLRDGDRAQHERLVQCLVGATPVAPPFVGAFTELIERTVAHVRPT